METSPVIHLVTDAKGTVIHEVHVQMQELPLGMKALAPEVGAARGALQGHVPSACSVPGCAQGAAPTGTGAVGLQGAGKAPSRQHVGRPGGVKGTWAWRDRMMYTRPWGTWAWPGSALGGGRVGAACCTAWSASLLLPP